MNRLPVSFNRISLDYKIKAFLASAGRPSPLEHFGWTEVFHPEDKENLFSPYFKEQLKGHIRAESYIEAYQHAGTRQGLEKFLFVDQKTHMLDEFLVKVDRLSMAHSLEVRPPFLDLKLVEFAAEIPMSLKIKGTTTKYILRKLMEKRLPKEIITGSKKGFSPPMAKWLASDLFDYVAGKFSPENLHDNPYLNANYPRKLLQAHTQKKINASRKIWTLLMFIEWYDRKVKGI